MPLKICFLGLIVIFLLVKCDVTIDPENSAPQIEIIGFTGAISNSLTFAKNKSYEFKFKVTDGDGDQMKIGFWPDSGKVERFVKGSEGLCSAFYRPNNKGQHRIPIVVSDRIEATTAFLSINFVFNFLPEAKFTSRQINKSTVPDTSFVYEFDPTKSSDRDGEIKRVKWDFNGILIDTNKTAITVRFDKFDTYNIKLEVFDDLGDKGTADTSIYNALPVVSISSEQASSHINDLRVKFSPNISNNNLPIKSIKWDFGDNTVSNELTPVHLYSNIGDYNVSCSVTDEIGRTVDNKIVKVIADSLPPLAKFTFNGSLTFQIQNLDTFGVDASESYARDGTGIKEYQWFYKKEGSQNLGTSIKNGLAKEKLFLPAIEVGNWNIGVIAVSNLGLKSKTLWRKLTVLNTNPIPSYELSIKYHPRSGLPLKWGVYKRKATDIDPNETFYYRWYTRKLNNQNGQFEYIPQWDNTSPSGGKLYPGDSFTLRLEVEDSHGGRGVIDQDVY